MTARRMRYRQMWRMLYSRGLMPKLSLFLRVMLMIFGISFSLMLILVCLLYLADTHGLVRSPETALLVMVGAVMLGGSLLSLVVAFSVNRMVIQPMRLIFDALEQVGKGNFDICVSPTDDAEEIGVLADTVNRMIQSLRNVETMRDDFIANVSHELKTPLASIQGCAALLQDDNVSDEERRMYAGMVYNSAKRLSVLSGHILEISKLDHGDVEITETDFMLDEHLRQALLLLQQDWQEKDIELNLELDEVKYRGSDELLMQVWINLLGNAIKFSSPGGRLDVTLEKMDGAARVTIRDWGIGIAPDEQQFIFEKFYQADTSHKTEGNGLGLAMVRRIIRLLNAKISVESEGVPGRGTAFVVTLPASQ